MDSEKVPSSLVVEIAPILRVADEIESENPRVAYFCLFYAFEKAQKLDPASIGHGVLQFKNALLERLERQHDLTLGGKRRSDSYEMKVFYQNFYGKHMQRLQNAYKYDRARLTKDYQTGLILFEVLKAVDQAEPFKAAKETLKEHTRRKFESSDQALAALLLRHPEPNHPRIPLDAIKSCTENFSERNFIAKGGYGKVYKGILNYGDHVNKLVAVKRLDVTGFQGNKEFHTEVTMLSQYQHENIITLVGFCDDNNEMILVYEFASHGSLDKYLRGIAKSDGPSWPQLLKICNGIASALDYLHNHVAEKHRIIHRDIKCANILLDENWNAKLADFGLARVGLANQENTFVITNLAGTHGYCDPQYERTGFLTKESDVYSFGVVLFEVLCGRLACDFNYNDERRFLHHLARTCYENRELHKIIDQRIMKDIKPQTLLKFSAIAYQCLQETREDRPTISQVAFQLQEAMKIQLENEFLQDEVAIKDGTSASKYNDPRPGPSGTRGRMETMLE